MMAALSYRNQPLICGANQWTGFYMMTASAMKDLIIQAFNNTGLFMKWTLNLWHASPSLSLLHEYKKHRSSSNTKTGSYKVKTFSVYGIGTVEYLFAGAATGKCSVKIGGPKNLKFKGKCLCRSLFRNKVAGRPAILLKKKQRHTCFPVNFVKFLRIPPGDCFCLWRKLKKQLLVTSQLTSLVQSQQ